MLNKHVKLWIEIVTSVSRRLEKARGNSIAGRNEAKWMKARHDDSRVLRASVRYDTLLLFQSLLRDKDRHSMRHNAALFPPTTWKGTISQSCVRYTTMRRVLYKYIAAHNSWRSRGRKAPDSRRGVWK